MLSHLHRGTVLGWPGLPGIYHLSSQVLGHQHPLVAIIHPVPRWPLQQTAPVALVILRALWPQGLAGLPQLSSPPACTWLRIKSVLKMSQGPSFLPLHKGLPVPSSPILTWAPEGPSPKTTGGLGHFSPRVRYREGLRNPCLFPATQTGTPACGAERGRQDLALPDPHHSLLRPGLGNPTWTGPSPRPDFLL